MKPPVPFSEKVLSAIFIILAVSVFISIWRVSYIETTDKVGPKLYPWLLSGLLVVFSGLLLTGRASSHKYPDITLHGMLRRFLPLVLICVLYCVTLPFLGFLIPTTALLVASFYLLGERNHWRNILIAAGCTGATYLLFSTALGIQIAAFPG